MIEDLPMLAAPVTHLPARSRTAYKLYTIREMLALKDDKSKWIVQNMLPRVGRTFVYGKGGAYKSCVLFDLSVAVASGGMLLEQFPVESYGPVILISTEGSIFTNRDRLVAHMRSRNIHPEVVQLYYGQRGLRLGIGSTEDFQTLEQMIRTLKPVLVVLDPYISFFSGNENSTQDAGEFCRQLDYLIDTYNFSLVVIHHANKKGELRGSSAVQGWCDTILNFSTEERVRLPGFDLQQQVRVLTVSCEKQREGRDGNLFSAVVMIDEQVGMTTFGILTDVEGSRVVVAYLKQQIYKVLSGSGRAWTTRELADHFRGVAHHKVTEALSWLEADGLIDKGGLVSRSTSADGSRTRQVDAWRVLPGRVDMARAMLRAQLSGATEDDRT